MMPGLDNPGRKQVETKKQEIFVWYGGQNLREII